MRQGTEVIRLTTIKNKEQADGLLRKLNENGIAAYYEPALVNIFRDYSLFGEDVFVLEMYREKAEKIVKSYKESLPNQGRDNIIERLCKQMIKGTIMFIILTCGWAVMWLCYRYVPR